MKQRIVFIKPIWVVLLYICVFTVSGIWNVLMPQYLFLGIIIVLSAVIFQMSWAYNTHAYIKENEQGGQRGKTTLSKVILIAGIIGYTILGLIFISGTFGWQVMPGENLTSGLVGGLVIGNLSVFTLIGIAAYTLEKAEKGAKASVWNIIGTCFQIFYFPIGIWFLHPRLKKLQPKLD